MNPDRLKQLLDGFETLSTASDPAELDRPFCAILTKLFDAELASILDMDSDGERLRFRYSMDLDPAEMEKFAFRLGEGICGAAALTGNVISVFDASQTPQHSSKVTEGRDSAIGSLLAVPIMREGRCISVIEIMNRREGRFDETDKSLARLCASLYWERRSALQPSTPTMRKKQSKPADAGPKIIGSSLAMERILRLIIKAAPTDLPILILGETGTGKELIAQRVHASSARSRKPLVAINCAALTETLLESELFGHVKGAFTGAAKDRRGKLEEAHGGTIFLDEVGDMTAACQAKLLRALDYGEISPVGSNEVRKIDIRVIAATNQPLAGMVQSGKFRADLYYRLRGFQMDLPPLRERPDDIPLLAQFFLDQILENTGDETMEFSESARELLSNYPWPGNVRELLHAVKMSAAVAEGNIINAEDFPAAIQHPETDLRHPMVPLNPNSQGLAQSDDERSRIIAALEATSYPGSQRWNLAKAARVLGMQRKTLEYKARTVYRLK